MRAIGVDLLAMRPVQGGSTITEQLPKNLLPPQHSEIGQKLHEMGLALVIEHRFSKDQILEFYLDASISAAASTVSGERRNTALRSRSAESRFTKRRCWLACCGHRHASTRRMIRRQPTNVPDPLRDMVVAGYLTEDQLSAAEVGIGSRSSWHIEGKMDYRVGPRRSINRYSCQTNQITTKSNAVSTTRPIALV